MQAPADLLAIPALIAMAACIGKDVVIRPKAHDTWTERACLWGMLVQPPGSMKSAALSKGMTPLRRIQDKWFREDQRELAEWLEKKKEADLRGKAWERECAKLMKKPEEGYDCVLPPRPRCIDDLPPKPKLRRLITQDATVEKLADLMVETRGMSLVRDELAGFVENMSRYNAGSDRQFYLEAYSGGSFAVDRIGRGEQIIDDLYLNICGGIQPSVAAKLFSTVNGVDDGFFDRFGLIAFPDMPENWELVDRLPNWDLQGISHRDRRHVG